MSNLSDFGPPAIQLGTLRIWVHGYHVPDATNPWDGNRLRVTALCAASGTTVEVTGAILDTFDFLRFQEQLAAIYERLQGEAVLESSYEKELKVEIRARGATGQMEVRVEITPDQLNQGHFFILGLDQSYLPEVIRGCEQMLCRYPVRDVAALSGREDT